MPAEKIGPARPVDTTIVYLLDRPQLPQSVINVAIAAPPTSNPAEIAIVTTMNSFFGGSFSSRCQHEPCVRTSIRRTAHARARRRASPRAFVVNAPVQTDKTKESLIEVKKELDDILASRPATQAELDQAKAEQTLTLAGRWETSNSVLGSLADIARYGLPDDYWTTYAGKVRALTTPDVDAAAKTIVAPSRAVWIVVGDRAKIEQGVRDANIGEVVVIDADGKPVGPKP